MLASTPTKLPLATWAAMMGLHPIHFGGVQFEEIQNAYCDQAWFRYNWQSSDRVGWEEVALAIANAEERIEDFLGYHLLPAWEVDERVMISGPNQPELINLSGRDVSMRRNSLFSRWGHVISGGIRATDLLGTPAIAWSSTQAPAAYTDLATVTVADPGLADLQEVKIFYPGKDALPIYEIRPLTSVTSAAGTITITFPRYLVPTEAIQDRIGTMTPIDGTDDANFLATVEVYRIWNDPQTQVSFLWEPESCDTNIGVYATQAGALLPRDFRLGTWTFAPADWDATTSSWVRTSFQQRRQPDEARLYYYSGFQSQRVQFPRLQLDPAIAQAVAVYAASMLARDLCDCSTGEGIQKWRDDLAHVSGGDQRQRFQVPGPMLRNPFGTKRGAVEAWKYLTGNAPLGVRQGVVQYR